MTQVEPTEVLFFRPRRPGPELWFEDAVLARAHSLVSSTGRTWLGASVPMGMTRPDLTIVTYEPVVSLMSRLTYLQREMLTYLRAVKGARVDTIAARLQRKA